MSKDTATADATLGVIRSDETYVKREAMSRLGWGRHAYDAARLAGLKTIERHNRVYIDGADLREYLRGASAVRPPQRQSKQDDA